MDAVLNWVWRGGVVAMTLSLMLVALGRAHANVRYLLCWAAALVVIALPAIPSLQSAASVALIDVPQNDAIVALPDAWWTSSGLIVAGAMLWAGIHVVRVLSAAFAMRRARRRARPFPPHLESVLPHWRRIRDTGRRATLVLSNSVASAAVLGCGTPTIAVSPSLVRRLDPEDLDRVLIHEWAHVQRRDDVLNVLQIALRSVAGWHPALWWIDHRLRIEREIACDEIALAITGLPRPYAECLMKISTMKGISPAADAAPAVFSRSGLRARVVKIVTPHHPLAPLWSRTLATASVLVLCLLSVALRGLALVEAEELQPVPRATTVMSGPADRPVRATAMAPSVVHARRSPRRPADRSSSSQRSNAEAPVQSPQPDARPSARPDAHAPHAEAVTRAPETTGATEALPPEAEAAAPAPTPAPQTPTTTPDVPSEPSRSPWAGTAAGGAAIGKKSRDAGVATAGFFSRFARRVAGSF